MNFDQVLALWAGQARDVVDLIRGAPPALLEARPAPGEWSAGEVFAHILAADDIFAPRFFQALVRPGVILPNFDERRWAEIAGRSAEPLDRQLRRYRARRRDLTAFLASLPEEDLGREVVREGYPALSLDATVAIIRAHEADHLDQLSRALAAAGVSEPFSPDVIAGSYDGVAGRYGETFSDELADKPLDRYLLDRLAAETKDHGVVADIGCGPGHVAGYLAEQGTTAIGIDLSAGMVAEAKRRHPDLEFRQGNVLALDVADAAWAGAVAFYSLIHLPRPQLRAALGELHRVLAPGGHLLIALHGGDGAAHPAEMLGQPVQMGVCFWAIDELQEAVAEAGFGLDLVCERAPVPREFASRRLYIYGLKPATDADYW